MSDAFDPRQEFPPGRIIAAGVFLVVFTAATVAYIIKFAGQ